jgi:hypothetical protein
MSADMTLHILKLGVGADSVDDMIRWHAHQSAERRRAGLDPRPVCDTRMAPKQRDEVLNGGSLYWVVKGVVLVRQRILDIVEIRDPVLGARCEIVLEPVHHRTAPQPRRAFQGWRYLKPEDAPSDLSAANGGGGDLPDHLRRELIALGAW